jgi:quercetin dioxygenase-like cupin family protein
VLLQRTSKNCPAEKIKPHQHPGVEFLYLVSGELALRIASEEYTLEAGDSIYFNSGVLHSYRRVGKKACNAIIVTVP